MAKKPESAKSTPMPSKFIPQRKQLAMGGNPDTGCGSGPKTKQ